MEIFPQTGKDTQFRSVVFSIVEEIFFDHSRLRNDGTARNLFGLATLQEYFESRFGSGYDASGFL